MGDFQAGLKKKELYFQKYRKPFEAALHFVLRRVIILTNIKIVRNLGILSERWKEKDRSRHKRKEWRKT